MSPLRSIFRCSVSSLYEVAATHCHLIKSALIFDVYLGNRILNSYIKCKDMVAAVKLFEEMPNKDTVTWNTVIAGYVNSGTLESAWGCVVCMKKYGVILDGRTFGSMLKGVGFGSFISWGPQLHCDVLKMGYEGNVYCGSALLDMYAKCRRFEDASRVFYCMPERNVVSWNSMVSACADQGSVEFCFELVKCMERDGSRVDDGTFAPILPLLDDCKFYELAMQVHAKMEKTGLCFYNTVFNALITAYSGCGCVRDAERVFYSGCKVLDLVSWNSMLAAYNEHDHQLLAFKLFSEMVMLGWEPDIFTYTTIVTAVPEGAQRSLGKSLHALVIKRGLAQLTPISNSLAAMYMGENNNSIEDAVKIFQYTELKDIVSWNTILTALSQNRLSEDALKLFLQMHSESLEIDHYSFSAGLRSCSDLATLRLGQQIHALAIRLGLESNEYATSALIFMYSKCGIIDDAWRSFEASSRDSSIIWNSIMFAYAQHGQGKVALDLFHIMGKVKVKPDHITFVAALMACSHIGLVEEGHNLLKYMESEHGIPPRMEHYACAIDLFG
ncbi:hypothetical protein LIER_32415 [Lithospermum erythrorhizon]|uniref:Pentatricopeptide repeat-containing protein n=1 Tax=Lithospermum erythrorhizon TaxID=34254 RepID=A0AAV3RXN1_LITER